MSRVSCIAAALLYLANVQMLASPAWADEPQAESSSEVDDQRRSSPEGVKAEADRQTPAQRIREKLLEPTSLGFVATELTTIMEFLSDLHGLQIVLDQRAMEDTGVSGDTPVSAELRNISLRSALKLLLDPLDLVYTTQNEVLLITTQDAQPYTILSYDIGRVDPDLWIEAFQMIEPQSWDKVGGAGETRVFNNLILVRQTEYVHEQLAELFAILQGAALAESAVAVPRSTVVELSNHRTTPPDAVRDAPQ